MKIVFGQVRPDGRQHRPRRHNPRPRRRPRLAVTRRRHRPQELAPIVDRTVYENLFVGREVRSSVGLLDRRAMIRRAREMLDVFGVSIDSTGPVRTLSVALQQIVEIVKTTSRGANVVLLDEPTAAIADREVDLLYGIVLGEQGVAMQYTTHKLAEIRALADRVIAVKAGLPDTSGLAARVLPDDVAAGVAGDADGGRQARGQGKHRRPAGPAGAVRRIRPPQGHPERAGQIPGIKVLAPDTANWKGDEAVDRAKNWLSSFSGKLNGVVSENDDMGLGALQAAKEAGVTLPMVGIDGIVNAVKNGEFIGRSLQHGRVEMAAGLGVAMRIAKGEQVKTPAYVMATVTNNNVDAVLAEVVTGKDKLLARLPALVDQNLQTGNIAYESLPGQTR